MHFGTKSLLMENIVHGLRYIISSCYISHIHIQFKINANHVKWILCHCYMACRPVTSRKDVLEGKR
jgi:hypothetical protein